jgi:Tn3 transposase DDE domain-containing protein
VATVCLASSWLRSRASIDKGLPRFGRHRRQHLRPIPTPKALGTRTFCLCRWHEVEYNIVTLSRALDRLQADGLKASAQAMATLTPYQTEHINRFGNYTVNFSRTPEPLPPNLRQSEGQPLVDYIGL